MDTSNIEFSGNAVQPIAGVKETNSLYTLSKEEFPIRLLYSS